MILFLCAKSVVQYKYHCKKNMDVEMFSLRIIKKLKKLTKKPGVFFRDCLNKRYPVIYNEVLCPESEETILIKHDDSLEKQIIIDFPIDIVFTWVDDQDLKWQEKYSYYKRISQNHGQYATDVARFSNHNELYYSLKSIKKNMGWVNNIYIVVDGQSPSWINEFSDVYIIDHKDIISCDYLPTFNSHVIEAHLHLIKDLSEHFIYFNDDVFAARKLLPGHFFRSENISSLFISKKNLIDMSLRGVLTPTLSASMQSRRLIQSKFSKLIDTPLVHSYVPLTKKNYEHVWQDFNKEIHSFLGNKFRTNNDLNLATFLVPWYSYVCGRATPVRDICYYFNVRSAAAKDFYKSLLKKRMSEAPHSFCANDFTSTKKNVVDYKISLINNLNKYFDNESN